jgi:hypothetical protein
MIRHVVIGGRVALAAALLILSGVRNAYADDIPPKIDVEGARKLAYEAVGRVVSKGSFDYDGGSANQPFIGFQAFGDSVAGSFGFYAVNPWTGDVWALWGCRRLSTPALRKAQKEIKDRFTPSERADYQRLHKLRPVCITD